MTRICRPLMDMSKRRQTLGMEPSERRALEIMRLACEQSDEIVRLQSALDEMTERCRTAEIRVRAAVEARCADIVVGFPLTIPEQHCCPTELGRALARDLAIVRALKS